MTLSVAFRFLALTVLSFCVRIQAVPYEGNINLQYHTAPIWLELTLPAGDGPISGSYFYKRVGKPILLKGERRGDTLRVTETDAKRGVTGTFTFKIHRDSLVGNWVGPKDVSAWTVQLFKADPADKKYAYIPKPESLILAAGGTLADRIKEYSTEDERDESSKNSGLCRKGIYSVTYYWEYSGHGRPPSTASFSHTFDLSTRKEIVLNDEIEPKRRRGFYSRVHARIQSELSAHRKDYPDSQWINVLGDPLKEIGGSPDSALEKCFQVEGPCHSGAADYTLYEDGVQYGFTEFFDFSFDKRPMEFTCHITIPYAELKRDLRKGSRLLRLAP